jgi:hypothetical protein
MFEALTFFGHCEGARRATLPANAASIHHQVAGPRLPDAGKAGGEAISITEKEIASLAMTMMSLKSTLTI